MPLLPINTQICTYYTIITYLLFMNPCINKRLGVLCGYVASFHKRAISVNNYFTRTRESSAFSWHYLHIINESIPTKKKK